MAIEDGVVLARALADAPSIEAGLTRYEDARRPRTGFVQDRSRERVRRLHGSNPEGYERKSSGDEETLGLFGYNPATVAV